MSARNECCNWETPAGISVTLTFTMSSVSLPLPDNPGEANTTEITLEDHHMEDLNPPIAIAGSERPSGNEDQLGEQPVGITSSAAPLQEGSRAFETQVLSALIDTMERMRMDRQEGEGLLAP